MFDMLEPIIKTIDNILEHLDQLQEQEVFQNNEQLMNELGEAIGHLENARDELQEDK